MLSGHRSARRRRSNKSRAARIAVPLAIPMALGLTLGIIIAVSGGGKATTIQQSAMGSCAWPLPRPGRCGERPRGRCERPGGGSLGRAVTLPVGIRPGGGGRRGCHRG